MKIRKTPLLLFFLLSMLSACVSQTGIPENYPMTAADVPTQAGDVVTELSARSYMDKDGTVVLHYPKINHTAALQAFKRHIAAGLPVNTTDSFGLPAVAHAAAVGDVTFLTELIARGAELNYAAALKRPEPGNSCIFSGDDLSPTALAAQHGQTAALELLLRHGAHPYGVERAIDYDHLDCLKRLHAAGGNLHEGEYTCDDEFYPNTCNARSAAMLAYLLNNGISSNIPLRSLSNLTTNRESAKPYIDMYLRAGIWPPAQAEQFLNTYYPLTTVSPTPPQH